MSSYNWGRDTQLDSVLQCGVVESREVHQPHPKHHYNPTKSVPFWWTDNMSILVYDCVIKCDGHSKIHLLNLVSCPRHSKWSREKCRLLKAFQAFPSVGYFTLSQANSLDNFKEGRNWSFGPSKNHWITLPWCSKCPLVRCALLAFFKKPTNQGPGIFGSINKGWNRLVGHFLPGKVSFTSSSNSLAHFWRPWPSAWCVPQMWVASKVQGKRREQLCSYLAKVKSLESW